MENGKNVMIFGVPNVAYTWRCLKYHWPNKAWPSELEVDMTSKLQELSAYNRHQYFWYKAECTPNAMAVTRNLGGLPGVCISHCAEEKYEFLEEMAYAVNDRVHKVLSKSTCLPFNVLSTDYVHNDIIAQIIDFNNQESGAVSYSVTKERSLNESLPAVVVDIAIPPTTGLLEVRESNM